MPTMITVAICTRNRAAALEETLESLRTIPPDLDWELIVCGNACNGGTESVAKSFSGTLPLRFAAEPALGLSNARNRCLLESRGAVVAFIDDDVTLQDGWLQALRDGEAANPTAGVFGGPIAPVFPPGTDSDLLEVLPSIRRGFAGLDFGPAPRTLEFPDYPFGANMAFRREAVQGLQFDPSLGYRGKSLVPGEERAFVAAVVGQGWTIAWLPGMRLEHRIAADRLTLPYLSRLTRDYTALASSELPVPRGRQLAGVPRWLVRRYLELRARALVSRMTGHRGAHIARSIEAARILGQIAGVRRRHAIATSELQHR